MSTTKTKTTGVITTLTLRLSEDTGDVGYKGTLVAARGERALIMQFEYFDAKHMTEAIEAALQKLEATAHQPAPQATATPEPEPPPQPEPATTAEEAASPTEPETADLPDAASPAVSAEDEASAQPSLF